MVQIRGPPRWIQLSARIREVAWARPCAQLCSVQGECDIGRPNIIRKREFGTDFHADVNLLQCVIRSSEQNQLFGPGHNSFTRSEDGEDDVLVYHVRPKIVTEGDPLDVPDRHAHAQVFTWSADGFPIFGEPGTDNNQKGRTII
ncbi:MAG TPA: hypothetical protein DD651_03145 [Trichococcus sp.]|nr:hypothetical protein [Bacilli bacterium]HBQ62489.1 hypothetical protein [Trichococcus sp.]